MRLILVLLCDGLLRDGTVRPWTLVVNKPLALVVFVAVILVHLGRRWQRAEHREVAVLQRRRPADPRREEPIGMLAPWGGGVPYDNGTAGVSNNTN